MTTYRSGFGTIIGWTADGAAYCPEHKPTGPTGRTIAGQDGDPSPVFDHERSQWEDGGLECDRCDATIVESDTCRTCDRSLRDDHDAYSFGPADQPLAHVDALCRPHTALVVLVRETYRPGHCTTHEEIVPEAPDLGAFGLDALVAAYAGRVATFDIVETEEVTA